MYKILIIGKKSFIGSNLKKILSKNFYVKCLSFEEVIKKKTPSFQNIPTLLILRYIKIILIKVIN